MKATSLARVNPKPAPPSQMSRSRFAESADWLQTMGTAMPLTTAAELVQIDDMSALRCVPPTRLASDLADVLAYHQCESTYTRADHLARHKAVRHPENSPPKIHCICGRTFQRRDVLIRHQKQSCLGSVEDQIRLYGGTKKRKLGCRQSENSLAHLASVATGDEGTESPNKTTTACRPCAVSK